MTTGWQPDARLAITTLMNSSNAFALPTVEEIEAELAEVVKKKPALRSRGKKKGGGE